MGNQSRLRAGGMALLMTTMTALWAGSASADPVAARVTRYDNVHLRVADPVKATQWYVANLGATATGERGATFGDIVIAFVKTDNPLPSAGSAIDHIAISVPDLAGRMKQLAAAGVKITAQPSRSAAGYEAGFIEDPWGTRIEVLHDPQSLGFHHVHLAASDPDAAVAWFQQMIGGDRLSKGTGLRFGNVLVLAEKSAAAPAPSAERAIMNVAFRVTDIHKAVDELKGKGVKVATEPTAIRDLWYAFLDAPSGVRFELLQRP
jgi:catechol 2,3-dioxygenase-like lactoylglutathione lyase family enzyme